MPEITQLLNAAASRDQRAAAQILPLAYNELRKLAAARMAAELAKLRVLSGVSVEEAGDALGIPRATGFRTWIYARAWLIFRLADRL
jgi:hypothetical protein